MTTTTADVVVIGAGMVGACCARALVIAGLDVVVVDRSGPVGGTTGAGEGNILVSDKVPGPELALARRSRALWTELAAALGPEVEFETKGGLVVAADERAWADLVAFTVGHAAAGVTTETLDRAALREHEPHVDHDAVGAMFWPDDAQVQPMRAAVAVLQDAVARGVRTRWPVDVRGAQRAGARLIGLETDRGSIHAAMVVNACGPWAGEVARRLEASVPVTPRRGHVLVTEPLPPMIRHKVYAADYVSTVESDALALLASTVVEGTPAGPVLVGSTREFVGWDRTPSTVAVAELARRAIALFPFLAGVRVQRTYLGFRPASPDHLPIIGVDALTPGLVHATGHEGAGIGLAPATAELVTALATSTGPPVDGRAFAPSRFARHE